MYVNEQSLSHTRHTSYHFWNISPIFEKITTTTTTTHAATNSTFNGGRSWLWSLACSFVRLLALSRNPSCTFACDVMCAPYFICCICRIQRDRRTARVYMAAMRMCICKGIFECNTHTHTHTSVLVVGVHSVIIFVCICMRARMCACVCAPAVALVCVRVAMLF